MNPDRNRAVTSALTGPPQRGNLNSAPLDDPSPAYRPYDVQESLQDRRAVPRQPLVEDQIMAKALFGHVGTDARMADELRRLRHRVVELEEELRRVREANDALVSGITVTDEILRLPAVPAAEPALT